MATNDSTTPKAAPERTTAHKTAPKAATHAEAKPSAKEAAADAPAPSAREGAVQEIGQRLTEQAAATQQPSAPGETGAPVPAEVALPNFGEQGAQQHTLNAQAGVTASTDVPGAIGEQATPAEPVAGATNPALAGPLAGSARVSAPAPEVPTEDPAAAPAQQAAPAAESEASSSSVTASTESGVTFSAPFGIDAAVIVDGPKGPQEATVKGVTFGEDHKPSAYSVEITGKPFNPMDPAHHASQGRPKEEFAASMVRKA